MRRQIRVIPGRIKRLLIALSLVGFGVSMGYLGLTARRVTPPAQVHNHVRDVDPETSCGPVSLAVVSRLLGKTTPIARFHEDVGAGDLGYYSMTDLLRALRRNGFAAAAVRFNPDRPPSSQLPLILHVDSHHFLTALPRRDGRTVLVDPPNGPTVVDWSELKARWSGNAVIVGPTEESVRLALTSN